ncbi:DUF3307 domain-containing protein [Actinomadura atramentaria]|uniref:DUF3307 domain-containing protein n=1 Tax=Actinomadura atramentaria TaxID=1990 RepID=UPI00037F1406|nr:DUF3307 domain-containing protein [Actinomadura atramentaria]
MMRPAFRFSRTPPPRLPPPLGGLLTAHVLGDYVLQPSWMAARKSSRWSIAALHGAVYAAAHLAVTRDPAALLLIGASHMVLDRLRAAERLARIRDRCGPDHLLPSPERDRDARPANGAADGKPWPTAVIDNTAHLLCNAAAVRLCRPGTP